MAGPAFAQAPQVSDLYVGGMIQSSFGNVTSQAFGIEAGLTVASSVDLFLEGGRAVDTAPASTGAAAQVIAAALAATQANVGYSVHEPATFADAGVRYRLPVSGRFQPYVLAGGGFGIVKADVQFTIGGADVTSRIDQYGIVLGSDLSGTTTKAMMVVGGGVWYPLTDTLYVDGEFRYNRVFVTGGLPFSRAGIGFGVRF